MDAYDIFKKISKGAKFSRSKKRLSVVEIVRKDDPIANNNCPNKPEKKTHNNDDVIEYFTGQDQNRSTKKCKKECDIEKKHQLLEEEEVNQYRNTNKINVVGTRIPKPLRTFEDFPIQHNLINNIKTLGYMEPAPIQQQTVPLMLNDRNILACAPTGSGKTAAFLIPIIEKLGQPCRLGIRALILCPTRELAKQTQRECIKLTESTGLRTQVISKMKLTLKHAALNKIDILITTPNRLCFLLQQEPPAINMSHVKWLIIDEADKLFESGNRSFRQQLDQVLESCTNRERKIGMFSATYTPMVAKWCVHNMKGLARITVGHRNAATDTVSQELLFVGNEQGKLLAFRDIIKKGITPPVLIFVQSKDRAQQLFNELIYDGINVDAIHADRTQLQRDNTVRSFREGKIWVLICTELMARGIDFKGVNLVINYDFPPSAISYVHRIGRAGRAGRNGNAITFFTVEDTVNLKSIAHVLTQSGCEVPSYMLSMKRRSRSERKKLEKTAPKRDNIKIIPKFDVLKQNRIRKRKLDNKRAAERDHVINVESKKRRQNEVVISARKKDTPKKMKPKNSKL